VAFNQQGKVVKTHFVDNTPVKYQQPFTDILKSMPAFKTSHISKDILQTTMALLWVDMHNEMDYKKYKERFDKKYTQYRDKAIQQMAGIELNTYIFSVNRFGWINCDRFLDDSAQKTELWVKSIDEGESKVMAVFEDINSVLQGQKGANGYSFPNIPIGRPVRLIAIGYKNGKPLLSAKNIKVGKETIAMDGFREFSLKELEAELNATPR
jgi:hypothetical protein